MQIDDKLINLTPGMAVTVKIKTGSRSVLSYLLSPLSGTGTKACGNANAHLHGGAANVILIARTRMNSLSE